MDETGILSGLRDIRLPTPPAGLGGGWQGLALIQIVIVIAALALIGFWRRRNAWRFEAARLFDEIGGTDVPEQLSQMAAVLRRVALLRSSEAAGRLSGETWLAQLDHLFGRTYFTRGPGRVFGDDLYMRPATGIDTDRLARDIARMLRRGAMWPW